MDDDLLARFTDEMNDDALMVGWTDYNRATKMIPIEAQIYLLWWRTLKKPDRVNDLPEYEKYFPRLREKSRAEQKQMLNEVIEWARTQQELMEDPRTDTRQLVLDWKV